MPQTSILGFFTTAAPKNSDASCTMIACPPQSLDHLADSDESKSCDKTAAAGLQLETKCSVRQAINTDVFGNHDLDFFVPTGKSQAAIVKVLPSHIPHLKNITSTLFPVRYADKFFSECLEDRVVADLSRVLLWDSQTVGWIRCRLEENEQSMKQIYVQALGVLAPYRGCGFASNLLDQVTQPGLVHKYGPTSIYCHVWESNQDGLEWYHNRGFKRIVLVEQYYRRLRPAGAWMMRKELT